MDEIIKNLQGSWRNDLFKKLHKQINKNYWACDIDFCLVEKKPNARIIAFLDMKYVGEKVTFSEVIAYNSLIKTANLYVVYAKDIVKGVFDIWQYDGGDWHPEPPIIKAHKIREIKNWIDFEEWEKELRK